MKRRMKKALLFFVSVLLFSSCAFVRLGNKANDVLSKAYTIPYCPEGKHWKTTQETLRDKCGNCVDKNFFVYYKLRRLGYDVRFRATNYMCQKDELPAMHTWVELNFEGEKYILDTTASSLPIPYSDPCYVKTENSEWIQERLRDLIKREEAE